MGHRCALLLAYFTCIKRLITPKKALTDSRDVVQAEKLGCALFLSASVLDALNPVAVGARILFANPGEF